MELDMDRMDILHTFFIVEIIEVKKIPCGEKNDRKDAEHEHS